MLAARVFFFQAEDGIRDHCVTGVQTCALPIFVVEDLADDREDRLDDRPPGRGRPAVPGRLLVGQDLLERQPRSEERRVGKEWRSRWWPNTKKVNGNGTVTTGGTLALRREE